VLSLRTNIVRLISHHYFVQAVKVKQPYTGLDRSWGFQVVESPRFQDSQHMKVVRLSDLNTSHLYPFAHFS